MTSDALANLSKTRFVAGLQCAKRLWWSVHEPGAAELEPDAARQRIFTRGNCVGEIARTYVPGGVLIDLPHHETQQRVAATAKALAAGAPVIYEASFLEDGVFVSVDILEREGSGHVLAEVKSTLDVKEELLPDVAIQLHVVRKAGLTVRRAELMHLNRECRYPDLSNLFVRTPVTQQLGNLLRGAPEQAASLRRMLRGPTPDVAPGGHCGAPYDCPFLARCWPPLPDHHISTLHRIHAKRLAKLLASGHTTLHDLSPADVSTDLGRRQLRSVQTGNLIVERGLARAIAALREPIAYLDFETINPAIPVWPGCAPYQQVPVQISCHVRTGGNLMAYAWLADGQSDPRRPLAERLLAACTGTRSIVAYNAPFEKRCIDTLAAALPDLAPQLEQLSARLVDLLPIVRDHIYHPDFQGSFSLKSILPALVSGLDYEDLEIQDGGTASGALEALLLESETLADTERRTLRAALMRYCERDTLAMVRLHERLAELA